MHSSHGDFTTILQLPPGAYQYKFIVDGKWQVDPSQKTVLDPTGQVNNVLEVKEIPPDQSLLEKSKIFRN
jgi:hypothetical protein